MILLKNLPASSNSSEYDVNLAKKFDEPIPNPVFVPFYEIEDVDSKDNKQDDANNNSQVWIFTKLSIYQICF